jgi:ABC-type antimicrobial peptide transport system permease subunit
VIYRPWHGANARQGLSIVIRTEGDPRAAIAAVRDGLASIDRAVPAQAIQTMLERMAVPLWPSRTLAGFFAVCGTLSLVLATVGLFGVTYYVVQQRTREFGVRLALGATRWRVLRTVLGDGIRVVVAGIVLGTAGALVGARLLSRGLVDISPADPFTYAATGVVQIAIALAACALPAWRASRTNPIGALRTE